MATDTRGVTGAVEREPERPASRICRDGQVLVCEGYSNEIRWQDGERLEDVFEQRLDELRHDEGDLVAVDLGEEQLTYAELESQANQLARYLREHQGVGPGDRVGLLFTRPVEAYAPMLAVLKLHAAYVPLDPGFPADRSAYICEDAEVKLVLSRSELEEKLAELGDRLQRLYLDQVEDDLAEQSGERLSDEEVGKPGDDLAYLIYTSGTTGRPKGVAINHPAICNFVKVAAEVYGYTSEDRVYQGLTNAFDFAVEEIWVPWMVGATLVPKPSSENLLGPELHEFLADRKITALCCVPTLLATLDEDLPDLRLLIVSGESCPKDLVDRWYRNDRRFLNVYGPTEATVTATWTLLHPDRDVTIGVPLPTYSVLILDPDKDEARALEQQGEIGIAGIALAEGYLNRPDKTESAFIDDFLGLENNPSGRIYRTGDLGRVNERGELEHLGRIDTQVKIRGYRIELAEIEAVLRAGTGIDQAVVSTHQPEPDVEELVAFYTACSGETVDVDAVYEQLQEKLPPYMVPAYLEQLDELPLMPSGKVDRKQLPEPSSQRRLAGQGEVVEADSETETLLAEKLAEVLGVDQISVESHFFDELGASSLLLARFGAELRRTAPDLPAVSMRDLYTHPTIRQLAEVLAGEGGGAGARSAVPEFLDPEQPDAIGTPRIWLCGLLQILTFLAYASIGGLVFDLGANWLLSGRGVGIYLRALALGVAVMLGSGSLPILAKWALVGRWKPQRIRIWSLPYFRFWLVKTLVLANPAARLVRPTLLYPLYLRALGTRIGAGAMLLSEHPPICTDLISIGARSVVRNNTYLNGYRARDGVIEIGPVSLGEESFVGENCVLDIYSTVQEGAAVGHASSVQAGQVVPAGEVWHGSPVEPAGEDDDPRRVQPLPLGRPQRIGFNLLLGLLLALVLAPVEVGVPTLLLAHPAQVVSLSTQDAVVYSFALVAGLLLLGLLVSALVPRLVSRWLRPGRPYPLYGVRYAAYQIARLASNIGPLVHLFGDSPAVLGYLRFLGWKLEDVEQTGSNCGLAILQESPLLVRMAGDTMISDGLTVMNADYSASSFQLSEIDLGCGCFLGNGLAWPAGAKVGDNVLVATKAMLPLSGEPRHDTGLLGSPPFEIPRTVEDDEDFARLKIEPERTRRLHAKLRYNVATMILYLLSQVLFIAVVLIIGFAPLSGWFGTVGSEILEILLLPAALFGIVDIAAGSRRLQPRTDPILERRFWRHERLWKLQSDGHLRIFDGTPFKGMLWRLLGVKVGPRLFDDGAAIVERSLTSIGADVTLNMGAEIQAHSLENGMFKSDRIAIGDGATIGLAALVHYGTRVGRQAVLEADSFLMKGSELADGARWRGNPADEVVRRDGCEIGGDADDRMPPAGVEATGCDDDQPTEQGGSSE